MASAGPERAPLGPEQEKSVELEPGSLPTGRARPRRAWRLARREVKPSWNFEKKYVSAFLDRGLSPSGIPLQPSRFLCPLSLCHLRPAEGALPSLPSARPCPQLGGSSLLCKRSCLRPEPYGFSFRSSLDTGSGTGRAMSSLVMEPCLLPPLAEERSGAGLKGSALGSRRQASSSYRPVLNDTSFLRPSGAKVPLLQSLETKKGKNAHSFPAASSPRSGEDGNGSSGSPGSRAAKSSDPALEQTAVASELSLTEGGQTAARNGFGGDVESSGLRNWDSGWEKPSVAQLTPKETAAPPDWGLGSPCLIGDSSPSDGAGAFTEWLGVRLGASRSAAPASGDRVVRAEPPQLVAVSEVVARVSAIQLEKKEEGAQAVLLGKFDVTEEQPPLELSQPQDEAEEELLDGLDESCSQEEEEDSDSDASSVAGVSSGGSVALGSRTCTECLAQPAEAQEKVLKPALVCSLFPNVPPTIYFSTRDERVEKLPWEQRKLLRWKMCTVTPNIVKQTVGRSHFRVSKKSNDWLGCWGHHMKSPSFRAIKEHQKLNHFPGSFQIGRKDRLWRNLLKMQARCGKREFNFFPQSFILPQDIKLLKKAWEEGASRQKWIVKPPASARGIGIQVIHKWSQLPKRRPLLVQRYLHKPYLIGGRKFDLRIYVYVTCYDPLRVYLFKDGLVRFASCKYSSSMKNLNNKFMHLTNYSVNKKNTEYKSNSDETACQGHKWALKALWSYLTQKGVNCEAIWEKIKDIVIKTIIASEPYVNGLVKMYVRRPYCCHELFGFDIMLDENLKPWILEVNISPSLHSNSPLDVSIKGQMIRDLLNLAGFVLPSMDSMASRPQIRCGSTCSLGSALKENPKPASEYFIAEKMKKAYYLTQKIPDQDFYSSVLDILTPDDIRILVETEDEYSRRGQFERVFPTHISMRYLRFFEQPRYFNILVTQWELKYHLNKHKGLELLKNWCVKGYHTGAGMDLAQTWSLPKSFFLQKSSVPSNGFSKLELGRLGTLLPSAGEDLTRCLEPSPTQSLPLTKCTGGADQNPAGCPSDTTLVM
ncbi:TTLL4 polyglutamylase, partial [Baryphthengus martii]|nr:TTLL4 polyglutamylase [Baryphthengus martii]